MYADAEAVLKICKVSKIWIFANFLTWLLKFFIKALILRSAALISAAVAGVVSFSCPTKRTVSVCVDGSVYKNYPLLARNVREMTADFLGPSFEITFRTSFDGSAKGAAFIAATNA